MTPVQDDRSPDNPSKVNERLLSAANIPFAICATSVLALLVIIVFAEAFFRGLSRFQADNDPPLTRFIIANGIPIGFVLIAMFSAYIGYRLIIAAGATRADVIPLNDYHLLAPLVKDGKVESIDQYVRLSSLTKSVGTFTQLGLTGLPIATIGLTLFFSVAAMFQSDNFIDLAKLTLGAFIGSFVQRQVERRAQPDQEEKKGSKKQSSPPDTIREASTPHDAM